MIPAATIILALAVALWMAEFALFPSRKNGRVKNRDNSFFLLAAAITLAIGLAIVLNRLNLGKIRGGEREVMFALGSLAALAGISLRYWAILKLGRNFSRRIQASPVQELASGGPFRLLRHPAYTGLMLITCGIVLFTTNLPAFILSIPLMLAAIQVRIRREEKFMEEVIGERYRRWKNSRRRLFPFVY